MRESKKKPEAELPMAPKPAVGPEPDKAGRSALAAGAAKPAPIDRSTLESLEARLFETKDANERRQLLELIQRQFGNEKAAQLMRKLGGKP